MNCTRCDAPLEPNVRFCRNCGLPVSAPASSDGAAAGPSPLSQPTPMNNAPTILPTRLDFPRPAQSPQPWPLIVRPYLNGVVKDQLNAVLADAVNQIPVGASAAVSSGKKVLTEDFLNNLIVLKSSSSDPVQNMHLRITPDQMRLEFQVYG